MSTQQTLSERIGKHFMPPDTDDITWQTGSETFTRDEVAHLLWTQIAMIKNDIKANGDMNYVLENPRIPNF